MNRAYRFLLLIILALGFSITAPLIVLYSIGYRFGGTIVEPASVGVVIIESEPRRSQITIDGEPIGQTPESIANLEPGQSRITVSKEGYGPWEKNISVEPASVTEFRNIRLFPEDTASLTLLSNVTDFNLSPNRQYIAAVSNQELHIIDEEGLPVLDPIKLSTIPNQLLWSPDSSNILLVNKLDTSLVNLSQLTSTPVRVPALAKASDITWDPRIPGRLLSISKDNDLIAYHPNTKSSEILASDVSSFATSSRSIYLVTLDNEVEEINLQGRKLKTIELDQEKIIEEISVTPDNNMAIKYADNKLFVLNNEQIYKVADNVIKYGWSPNSQLLYVQNEATALHVFNFSDENISYIPINQLKLVFRLSRAIQNPQWFAGGNHLIYQIDDEIIITEIDTRDHPISYSVDSTNNGSSIVTVGANGDTVMYLRNTTQTSGQLTLTSLVVE